MSDLCSPMIILLEDEADAFWCFERLMRRLVLTYLHFLSIKFVNNVPVKMLYLRYSYKK